MDGPLMHSGYLVGSAQNAERAARQEALLEQPATPRAEELRDWPGDNDDDCCGPPLTAVVIAGHGGPWPLLAHSRSAYL